MQHTRGGVRGKMIAVIEDGAMRLFYDWFPTLAAALDMAYRPVLGPRSQSQALTLHENRFCVDVWEFASILAHSHAFLTSPTAPHFYSV